VSHLAIKGSARAEDSAAKLSMTVDVTLLRTRWASIRLLPGNVALAGKDLLEGSAEAPRVFFRPPASGGENEEDFRPAPPGVTVGVVQACHCLVAQAAGDYRVQIDFLVPFSTSRKTGFQMALPRASSTTVEFGVHAPNILIKVDPSLQTDPVEQSETFCSVTACVPPSPVLTVNWTENKQGESAKAPVVEKLNANAAHEYLVAIGEGVVSLEDTVKYDISSGQLALCEFRTAGEEQVKVVSVEGIAGSGSDSPGVKRWEHAGKELKVWLDYGTDSTFSLKISAEISLRGTSDKFSIPPFVATATEGVRREKGNIAVDSDTGVEVQEIGRRKNAILVDRSELPQSLRSQGANILFGFKHIVPEFRLQFDVMKHTDCSVLIANVDSALHQATVSPLGGVVFRSTFLVQNTQKQYLSVSLPQDAKEVRLWSTILIDRPVKPAVDSDGKILIPLKKSSASESSTQEKFIVELTYLHESSSQRLPNHGENGNTHTQKGAISLQFPSIDLPINGSTFFEVRLPTGYKWDEDSFEGLKRVSHFSKEVPRRAIGGGNGTLGRPKPMRGGRAQAQANVMYDESDSESEDDEDDDESYYEEEKAEKKPLAQAAPPSSGGDTGKGLLPVDVDFPQTGRLFNFQAQMTTEGRTFALTADFETVDTRKNLRRSLRPKKICGIFPR
jgi:hypothetical protein